jgi:membrane-bound metal-dependent hydrolase YbcI (DUF457 family)
MRTYTHGVIGYLLYAKRSWQEQRLAVLGGILPDVFLALGFSAHYLEHVAQSATAAALHTLLHHLALHTVTVSLHSFVMVGPFLALSSVLYRPALPLFVGMFAHGIVDFLTHRQWAYNHSPFSPPAPPPLSRWRPRGPRLPRTCEALLGAQASGLLALQEGTGPEAPA